MADSDIFPDDTGEQILERVEKFWDFSRPFPWPRVELHCQVCGSGRLHPRYWRFFHRSDQSRVPHRCDVGVKCTTCSVTMVFGIPVSEEVFNAQAEREQVVNQRIWWRDVKYRFEPQVANDSSWEEIDADD